VKLLCFILSIYVILLSTKPCCTDNDCQGKELIKREQVGKMPTKEKECPGCSPFFTCGTCIGFIITKPFKLDLELVTEPRIKQYACYQQLFIQQVYLSIWQPPQLG
jgi:hypothetical protein